MSKTLKFVITLLLAVVVGVLLLLQSRLMFRKSPGGPDYAEMLQRISNKVLTCKGMASPEIVEIVLNYNQSDDSLSLQGPEGSIVLAYAGSQFFTDYFEGPSGQKIEVDPEIKLYGFSKVDGLCSD